MDRHLAIYGIGCKIEAENIIIEFILNVNHHIALSIVVVWCNSSIMQTCIYLSSNLTRHDLFCPVTVLSFKYHGGPENYRL